MVLLRNLLAHAANVALRPVVAVTVSKGEFHVLEELLYLFVLVVFNLLFYRSEVHGFSDYFCIVVQIQSNWIYRGCKEPGKFLAAQILQ